MKIIMLKRVVKVAEAEDVYDVKKTT